MSGAVQPAQAGAAAGRAKCHAPVAGPVDPMAKARSTKTAKTRKTTGQPARAAAKRSARPRTGRRSGSDGITQGEANTANTLGGMPIRTLTPHLVVEPAADAIA